MPRVDLALPERFGFETRLPIRVGDLNYGGHLGNDAVLALAQEARARWLAGLGLSELDVGGVGLLMADAAVVYRAEGRYGMVLTVALAPDDVRSRSFDLLYRLGDEATGEEIARVKTGLLCFDYAARKLARLPEALRAGLATLAAGAALPG